MINKLISLALLLLFLATSHSYSENQFLFPKKKPSVFKKIEINVSSKKLNDLPQKKPDIIAKNKKKIEIKKDEIKIKEKKDIKLKKKAIMIKLIILF